MTTKQDMHHSLDGGPILEKYDASSGQYSLLFVADRDQASFDPARRVWESLLARATLQRYRDPSDHMSERYKLLWHNETYTLTGQLAERGRGMELSELKWFADRLYTIDDRTGVLYQVMLPEEGICDALDASDMQREVPWVLPRMILTDGDGKSLNKGFKAEWMTVKDRCLIVGGMGKEWTHPTTGEVIGDWPLWIKVIPYDAAAHTEIVRNVNFSHQYNRLRQALLGSDYADKGGYILHEAVEWSEYHRRWFFLPRRVSQNRYHEEEDLYRGANVILSADESFENIKIINIQQPSSSSRGFSSFKFIPHRPNEIAAIKSEETADGITNSYITVVTVDGEVLMPETWFTSEKYVRASIYIMCVPA